MHPAIPEPEGEAPRSFPPTPEGEALRSLARSRAERLTQALAGIDLTSADGRAGIGALLSEIERLSPGAILRQAAEIELRRVGWGREINYSQQARIERIAISDRDAHLRLCPHPAW